jgi:hypothetical protein
MTDRAAFAKALWRKSSYSGMNNQECIEVAELADAGRVGIRDSKQSDGPVLAIPAGQFAAFVDYARAHDIA